mmetsp:Transcript_72943/g.169098  ORF Transcript_72943/g.169098 Transcript_72943/m.169098 type:complete len:643 (+) Transcript_72943:40-1968(+)
MAAPTPGYMALLPRAQDAGLQDVRRQLCFDDRSSDLEVADRASSAPQSGASSRRQQVCRRSILAGAVLAVAGTLVIMVLLGRTFRQLPSEHFAGRTALVEKVDAEWPRNLVHPPEAGPILTPVPTLGALPTLPALQLPQGGVLPTPAPLQWGGTPVPPPDLSVLAHAPAASDAPAVRGKAVVPSQALPAPTYLPAPGNFMPLPTLSPPWLLLGETTTSSTTRTSTTATTTSTVTATATTATTVTTTTTTTSLTTVTTSTATVTSTTTSPPDICNVEAVAPGLGEPDQWDLPDTTKDICFRMFSDQTKMTNHGKDTFSRNFCWVMMKHYGCVSHLGDGYTWVEAQESVSRLGGVPSASVSPFEPLKKPELCDRRRGKDAGNWTHSEMEAAYRWFQDNVAVYVLNLPSQKERWHNISRRLDDLQILSDHVPGFNMSVQKDFEDAYAEGAIPAHFNTTRAQEEARKPRNGMGGIIGTVGCAAGHFRALSRAAQALARRPVTLVLEDDAFPDDDFVPQIWSLVREELPCQWDAVSLGSRCPYGKCISERLSRVYPDTNEPAWRCRHGVNYGFQGVLYRTDSLEQLQRKWKSVVFDEERPHCLDVDVALASISDKVAFYAVPSIQAPLSENQDKGGSVRMKMNERFL